MEKINIENANKLFAAVSQKFDTPEIVEYKIGEDVFNIEIFTTLNVRDKQTLVAAVCMAAEKDVKGSDFMKECILASSIIEYLTNLPVPTVVIDDEEQKDIFVCHEIVFGKGGLKDLSRNLALLIFDILEEAAGITCMSEKTPFDMLCEKILSLMEFAQYELGDIVENPARQEEFLSVIEGMKKSDE